MKHATQRCMECGRKSTNCHGGILIEFCQGEERAYQYQEAMRIFYAGPCPEDFSRAYWPGVDWAHVEAAARWYDRWGPPPERVFEAPVNKTWNPLFEENPMKSARTVSAPEA